MQRPDVLWRATNLCDTVQVACDMGYSGEEGDERLQLVSFHSTSKVIVHAYTRAPFRLNTRIAVIAALARLPILATGVDDVDAEFIVAKSHSVSTRVFGLAFVPIIRPRNVFPAE